MHGSAFSPTFPGAPESPALTPLATPDATAFFGSFASTATSVIRRLLQFVLLLAASALTLPPPAAAQTSPAGAVTPAASIRILLRPKATANPAALARLYADLGCRVQATLTNMRNITILEVPATADVDQVIAALLQSGQVEYAERDQYARALMVPNDPYFQSGQQWSLNNTGAGGGTAGADIMAVQAWDVLHDAPNVLVAVVDSGIRLTHQDLAGNLWTNPGETGTDSQGRDKRTNGVDDDGDGYVDDVYGINVLNHSGNPSDDWGHGTHVAGVVGAVGNNGVGIAGIAWRVQLMACKFIDQNGQYTVSNAITALDYARLKGARIVTAAWGGYTFTSQALRDAIAALRDANIIVVAASGNDGTNNDATPLYPASYEYTNIVAVAATDRNDAKAGFSNYGAQTVDLGAPGEQILSAWAGNDSDYQSPSGTSMASAHVAGACALLIARYPSYTPQQIIARLLATVDPLPSMAGRTVSGGRLNLAAALAYVAPPSITSSSSAGATAGTAFTYQITATNSPKSYAATNLSGTGLTLNTTTGQISGSPAAAGTITSQITATNDGGTSAPVTLTITVAPANPGDAIPPAITGFAVDLSTATNTTASFVVTFSEPVTGVDASDYVFGTQGTATATVTGVTQEMSSRYRVAFNFGGSSGSLQLAIRTANTGIRDASGNAFVGAGLAASDPVPLLAGPASDITAPSIVNFTASTPVTTSVSFTVTFSEAVSGVSPDDFLVQPTSGVTATVGTITANTGNTVFTIPVTFSGTGSFSLLAIGGATSNIRDTATNWFIGGPGAAGPSVDVGGNPATPPTITSALSASATVGTAFSYQITASGSPTQFAATNLAGTGLSLNTSTGVLSGTPLAAGTISSQLTATNAAGTSAPVTLSITVSARASAPVVTASTITGTVGAALSGVVTATNNPTSYSLSGQPPGISINSTTGAITGVPTASGTYSASAVATNAAGSGTGTITFAISPATPPPPPPPPPPPVLLSQTVTFNAPTSGAFVGQPLRLGATASSGLPVSYSIVSGPGSISGDALTASAPGTIVVRAYQSGNGTWAAASAQTTITVEKAAQAMSAGETTRNVMASASIPLSVTSSSGLPVTYTLVTGPGVLSGNTLTFTGAAGTVVVRASQGGNDSYSAATPIDLTFVVAAVGPQVFFAKAGDDDFGAAVSTDNTKGMLVLRLAQTGEALVFKFNIASDGSFSTRDPGSNKTLTGTVANGTLSATLSATIALKATLQPPSGPTARYAGLYVANVPKSASGAAYLVAGPNGQAFAVAVTPTRTYSGTGTLSGSGDFNVPLTDGATLVGNIDSDKAAITGTLNATAAIAFAGLSTAVAPTDRLINISSRLRVTGGDASRFAIAGFVVTGSQPKPILIRAVGPGLAGFGLGNGLADPQLQVFNSDRKNIASNTGWNNDTAIAAAGDSVGAFKLNAGSRDAALLLTLPPGLYTAQVGSSSNSGLTLIEVYDVSANAALPTKQLVNISTRGQVGTGDDVLIGGFVVNGNGPKRVLVRGVGPGLSGFGVSGVLADPVLKLVDAKGVLVAQNDNWGTAQPVDATQFAATASDVTAAAGATGAFPLTTGSTDSAIVITLQPGSYTAILSGANSGTGSAMLEVYDIPAP